MVEKTRSFGCARQISVAWQPSERCVHFVTSATMIARREPPGNVLSKNPGVRTTRAVSGCCCCPPPPPPPPPPKLQLPIAPPPRETAGPDGVPIPPPPCCP